MAAQHQGLLCHPRAVEGRTHSESIGIHAGGSSSSSSSSSSGGGGGGGGAPARRSLGALPPVGLQAVDDAGGAKVLRPALVRAHVVAVRQEHPAHAAKGRQALRQQRRPARHVHEDVALRG